jgi:hypothetical protein
VAEDKLAVTIFAFFDVILFLGVLLQSGEYPGTHNLNNGAPCGKKQYFLFCSLPSRRSAMRFPMICADTQSRKFAAEPVDEGQARQSLAQRRKGSGRKREVTRG